ncbi:MAG: hypothetical protein IPJ13_22950 [Saprospiraceae bacterium]|nr:hypothetical protein [Saprospiraceae bacterium]
MSFTMIISKLIALAMIYLGYKRCFVWKYKDEGSLDKVTRWSAGLSLLLLGLVILIFVWDIFNLPPG